MRSFQLDTVDAVYEETTWEASSLLYLHRIRKIEFGGHRISYDQREEQSRREKAATVSRHSSS